MSKVLAASDFPSHQDMPDFIKAVQQLVKEGKTRDHGYVDVHDALDRMNTIRANKPLPLPPPLPLP